MKTRDLVATAVAVSSVSVAVISVSVSSPKEPKMQAPELAAYEPGKPPSPPHYNTAPAVKVAAGELAPNPASVPPAIPAINQAEEPLSPLESPSRTWTRKLASGETLDTVLAEAGFAAADRAEIALALGAEYDLRHLRPGNSITVVSTAKGRPQSVELAVADGVRIQVVIGDTLSARVVTPEPDTKTLARKTEIETSISDALSRAEIPVRFAVDLAQMLSGTVDFRRDLSGNETLRLLWRERSVDDERIGQPELVFAALEMREQLYEVVWPDDGTGRATIYVDGDLLRVFAQPVEGARLSSVFGRRKHPVYGNVRMHTGVDFAAARGTPVQATAPGRVSYIGWRSGYGRVVEIAHGSDTVTRYTHLSAAAKGLTEGQRVKAGEMIGQVGSTGTATGPNLHYEVLVDGRPTDPLSEDRLATVANDKTKNDAAQKRLGDARRQLVKLLTQPLDDRI